MLEARSLRKSMKPYFNKSPGSDTYQRKVAYGSMHQIKALLYPLRYCLQSRALFISINAGMSSHLLSGPNLIFDIGDTNLGK